jgi:uncharacterized protein YoxC
MAEMTAEEAAEWGKTLDFPTVWAALTKLGERIDDATKTVKEMGERVDQTTKNVNKMAEKVDRIAENLGGVNRSIGELIETLFAPHLGEKFERYHYNLKRIYGRVYIYDDKNRQRGEIDILLSNTTVCMAVEVKRWLDKRDQVDEHIRRMKLIQQYPPAEAKGKKLLGALASAVVSPEIQDYAEQCGFFVLELTGEDVHLIEPSKDFQPKEW